MRLLDCAPPSIFLGYLAFDTLFGSSHEDDHAHGGFVLNEVGGIQNLTLMLVEVMILIIID